ncbi:MAG: hypothetical protein ACKVPY_00820 [Paracoccaceae bacterium]
MPNMQTPLGKMTPEEYVACVIICCDRKQYDFNTDPADPEKSCQRMGSKKHSCVLHNLREHTKSGELTQKNKFPNSVRGNPPVKDVGGQNCIPDILLNNGRGWQIVDAKFPCDPKKLNPKLGVPPAKAAKKSTGVQYQSPAKSGKSMMTDKEKNTYPDYPLPDPASNKPPKCMSPSDAKKIKSDCACNKMKMT